MNPKRNATAIKEMRIIEQTVTGKRSKETCEDGIVITADFAAVIDGSTSKTPLRVNPSMSNGQYCMMQVKRYIETMPADTSVGDFCRGITRRIMAVYEDNGADMERLRLHPEERMTASAAVYSACLGQVWLVGDCQCFAGGTLFENQKPMEKVLAERRASFLLNEISGGRLSASDVMNGQDPGRELIISGLIDSCRSQNKAYSVIDGFPIPMQTIKVIDIPAGVEELVLASDGYPFLRPTLRESEAELRDLLDKDPLCISRFKATKGLKAGFSSFDDRCYIRLDISGNSAVDTKRP